MTTSVPGKKRPSKLSCPHCYSARYVFQNVFRDIGKNESELNLTFWIDSLEVIKNLILDVAAVY